MTIISEKACIKCGETKPLEEFHKQSAGKFGRRSTCKACRKIEKSVYRSKNRESLSVKQREYDARVKEKRVSYFTKYRRENSAKIAARMQNWWKDNPDKSRRYVDRRRAKLAGVSNDNHTDQQVWELYGTDCYLCGVQVVEYGKRIKGLYHEEHVIPLSKGGSNTLDNVRPSCQPCNNGKWANQLLRFLSRRTQDQLRSGELVITDSDHDWYAEHCRELDALNT